MKDKEKRSPQQDIIILLSTSSMNRTNRENPIKLEKYSQKVPSVPTSVCICFGSTSNHFKIPSINNRVSKHRPFSSFLFTKGPQHLPTDSTPPPTRTILRTKYQRHKKTPNHPTNNNSYLPTSQPSRPKKKSASTVSPPWNLQALTNSKGWLVDKPAPATHPSYGILSAARSL